MTNIKSASLNEDGSITVEFLSMDEAQTFAMYRNGEVQDRKVTFKAVNEIELNGFKELYDI